MKEWYGTEESFEKLVEVAIQNELDVYVVGYDFVVPYTCFYSCETYEELREKGKPLARLVTLKWDDLIR